MRMSNTPARHLFAPFRMGIAAFLLFCSIAGICNAEGNVVGLMPHPERASDALLGSDDGGVLLKSLVAAATGRATLLV